jgi:hypothetical protein
MTFHVIKNVPPLNRAIVFMDDLFGYGKKMSPEKWWDKHIGD